MRIFKKKKIKQPLGAGKKKKIPDGLWGKCPGCGQFVFNKIVEDNFKVCDKCGYHFSLSVWERIKYLLDEGSFEELFSSLAPLDPLEFKGPKSYAEKLGEAQKATSLKDAAVVGRGRIYERLIACGVTDSRFIMGSMGSVVGEKITRIAEYAAENRLPLVIVSGSGGGARMYEGMLSLMQMAKTSAALARLKEAGLPYISVLTHPTMAGVMASFAGLGDVIIAEPKALIGFTGPRVIKQTIKQDLPEGFQTSEFNLRHGLLDMIVERKDLKETIAKLLDYLS